MVAAVRKELRSVAVRASAYIVDRAFGDPKVVQLELDQRGEVPMRFRGVTSDHRATFRGLFHLASNVFVDLEGFDSDVRADGDDQLGWVVRKRIDGASHDSSHGAAPAGMRCPSVTARRMRDEDRDAIGGSRRNPQAVGPRDQRIAFFIAYRLREIGNVTHLSPMDLPLLVEAIDVELEALGEANPVRPDRCVVVAEMKTEIKSVVRRGAHAAQTRRESMAEAVPIQKAGMQGAHALVCSTSHRAGVLTSGQGSLGGAPDLRDFGAQGHPLDRRRLLTTFRPSDCCGSGGTGRRARLRI